MREFEKVSKSVEMLYLDVDEDEGKLHAGRMRLSHSIRCGKKHSLHEGRMRGKGPEGVSMNIASASGGARRVLVDGIVEEGNCLIEQ